jgi:hypothetical protein
MGFGELDIHIQKDEIRSLCTTLQRIDSKHIKDQHKPETVKLLWENP